LLPRQRQRRRVRECALAWGCRCRHHVGCWLLLIVGS
jgi:hypothetical protein